MGGDLRHKDISKSTTLRGVFQKKETQTIICQRTENVDFAKHGHIFGAASPYTFDMISFLCLDENNYDSVARAHFGLRSVQTVLKDFYEHSC